MVRRQRTFERIWKPRTYIFTPWRVFIASAIGFTAFSFAPMNWYSFGQALVQKVWRVRERSPPVEEFEPWLGKRWSHRLIPTRKNTPGLRDYSTLRSETL